MSGYTLYELIPKDGDDGRVSQFSSNVIKSKLDFAFLGVPYTPSGQTFFQIRGPLAAKCRNDTITVPTLVSDAGVNITDSWKIAEYLEEHYAKPAGKSLFGPTSEGKVFCRFIEQWSYHTVLPEIRPLLGPLIWTTLDPPSAKYYLEKKIACSLEEMQAKLKKLREPAFIDTCCQAARARLAPLETILQGHRDEGRQSWLNGVGPSHADFCVFGAYAFSRLNEDAVKGVWQHASLPRIAEWVEGMLKSGWVQEDKLPRNVEYPKSS